MDRRLLWAVLLMMGIFFAPTLFLKRSAPPATTGTQVSPESAAAPPPATAAPAVAAAPNAPVAVPAGPADTIAVTTPLAHYGVSTRGGVLTSLQLERYKSSFV